jgi:general stress protein 26
MAIFSVVLEDSITRSMGGRSTFVLENKRVVIIDAEDLDDAWHQARAKYYEQKAEGPDTQIVDIKAGEVTLQEEPQPEEVPPVSAEAAT